MSTFDLMPDAPGLLRAESVNIVIKFERTSDTTGRISWNIPTPAAGCTADTQAYCGMLVTLDTVPSTIDRVPVDGTVYSSDPTADPNLFAGDKLGSSYVIGGFYNDRETVMFDVTGLKANTAYYITGFPMDCQHRYFLEGVHAYSTSYENHETSDTTGKQVVDMNGGSLDNGGVAPSDPTGLDLDKHDYSFVIQIGTDPDRQRPLFNTECKVEAKKYTITIDGANAQTYQELVDQINQQLAMLTPAPQSPVPPNAGTYYWNTSSKKLFLWDGSAYVEKATIYDDQDPANLAVDFYWYNPATDVLNRWDGTTWNVVTVYNTPYDPAVPRADTTYWYDGTNVWVWNGTTWCEVNAYVQPTDPLLPTTPPEGSFWYNDATGQLYKWNTAVGMWFNADAVQAEYDPNTPPTTSYWFNESNHSLYRWGVPTAASWNIQTNVSLSETPPLTPAPGKLWYNPITGELFKRNLTNTTWEEQQVISFPVDPTQRESCDAWWNTLTDIISVWDTQTSTWIAVDSFFIQPIDPAADPIIEDGAVWIDTDTNTMYVLVNGCWVETPVIILPTDPRTSIADGTVWHNTTTNEWFVRAFSTTWVPINIVSTTIDPSAIPTGTFWFNPTNNALSMWNGISWVSVMYVTVPPAPTVGTLWFDTSTGLLMQWNGVAWVVATPYAMVEIDCNGNLVFTDMNPGSTSLIRLTDNDLFSSLVDPGRILTPVPGTDGNSGIPTYMEPGIGTDLNNAAREQMINDIRYALGYPVITVELTKEQLDFAVTQALETLRQRSSLGLKRGYFFMTVLPNVQRYFLTNKVQGMNAIVDVMSVQRLRSSALSSFGHDSGINGQILSQHLYNMGTFDLLSYHLMSEYGKLMEMLFATRITFNWNEQTRELFMYQQFPYGETTVLIEASVERSEQDIMLDRYARTWIRNFALAKARMMLAEIRGKFSTLPGAGGSVTLNADALRQAAQTEMEELILEIENYIADRPEEWGSGAAIVFG